MGLDAPVTMNGTLYSAMVCSYAEVTALEYPPTRMSTLSSVISLVAAVWPPACVDSSSPTIRSRWAFEPSFKVTPPSALILSAATCADCHMLVPTLLAGPVSDAITPTLIIPWDGDGVCCCVVACWVQPAMSAAIIRKTAMMRTVYFIFCPLCYDIAWQRNVQQLTLKKISI